MKRFVFGYLEFGMKRFGFGCLSGAYPRQNPSVEPKCVAEKVLLFLKYTDKKQFHFYLCSVLRCCCDRNARVSASCVSDLRERNSPENNNFGSRAASMPKNALEVTQ
jgi:hypothetical protein